MRFTCEKSMLVQAINIASRTVAQKSSLSVIEGILCRAGHVLSLTGYNMETAITYEIAAEINDPGVCILPAKLFADIIRRLPEGPVTVVVDETYKVSIRAGFASFTIAAENADDYPELPDVGEGRGIKIPQNALKQLIGGTIFAVSENQARPIHTGVRFEVEDNAIFTLGAKHILFQIGCATLVCRLLDGDFLDWKKVVPTGCPVKLVANVGDLSSSIERVGLIVSEKFKSPVRCTFSNQVLMLRTTTTIGNAEDQCAIAGDGKELEIGFNVRYLADALRAVPTEEVTLELTNGLSPIVLTPVDDKEDFAYMVLPVRLKSN